MTPTLYAAAPEQTYAEDMFATHASQPGAASLLTAQGSAGDGRDVVLATDGRAFGRRFWLAGRNVFRPVEVDLRILRDEVVAVNAETGIFGVGSSASIAVEDLRSALRDHLDALADEHDLDDDLQSQRRFLVSHLTRSAS